MNITLNSEQIEFIQQKLKSGRYQDANEVIVEAFRLLEERDITYQKWIEETQEKVDIAIEEIRRGEGIDGEIVVNQLKEKLRQSRQKEV
ncbi:MAG: type II toxin-antitoxin system ParD family antitoxin [Okeania sp. SIO3H1]|nr:type II toxin-antitoxin system ParD family antitoxin [Okeania sp. SIO3H1]